MRAFHIEIVTPDGLAYNGDVESVLLRTTEGDIEILAGHSDLLASVATGRVRLIIDGKPRYASASGGFLSVKDKEVRLCTITFEFAEDIDLKRAEKAKERAEAALSTVTDDREERIAKAKLMRALSRINVATKK